MINVTHGDIGNIRSVIIQPMIIRIEMPFTIRIILADTFNNTIIAES